MPTLRTLRRSRLNQDPEDILNAFHQEGKGPSYLDRKMVKLPDRPPEDFPGAGVSGGSIYHYKACFCLYLGFKACFCLYSCFFGYSEF